MNINDQVIPINLGMVKVFLIKGKKNILVDTGIKGNEKRIVEELKNNGITPQDISTIIITHAHADHVGGLKVLKELTGAQIIIHKHENDFLRYGKSSEICPVSLMSKIIRLMIRNTSIDPVEGDIIVEKSLRLKEYGICGKIIHTPGHMKGSIPVILESGEAIVGDLIAGGNKKNKDKVGYPFFASEILEVKRSIQKIIDFSPRKIYTCHGEDCESKSIEKLIKIM